MSYTCPIAAISEQQLGCQKYDIAQKGVAKEGPPSSDAVQVPTHPSTQMWRICITIRFYYILMGLEVSVIVPSGVCLRFIHTYLFNCLRK